MRARFGTALTALPTPPAHFDQTRPEHRRLTLNVGGFANLYEGTSIKVKCPVRGFERQKIYWTKDGKKLQNSGECTCSMWYTGVKICVCIGAADSGKDNAGGLFIK